MNKKFIKKYFVNLAKMTSILLIGFVCAFHLWLLMIILLLWLLFIVYKITEFEINE